MAFDREIFRRRMFVATARWLKKNPYEQCLIGDVACSPGIVRAHSIQSRHVLQAVAESGHVYMFKMISGRPTLHRSGINKATTFTGFCPYHDNAVFRDVDFGHDRFFDRTNPRQHLLLAFRAVAREYWGKLRAERFYRHIVTLVGRKDLPALRRLFDADADYAESLVRTVDEYTMPQLRGTEDALRRMHRNFQSLLHQLASGKYHLSRTRFYLIPGPPLIVASAAFPLDYDLFGRDLSSRTRDSDLPEVALNILPIGTDHAVLFHWHRRFDMRFSGFFAELDRLSTGDKEIVLSKMLLAQCENFALSPVLVRAMDATLITLLEQVFYQTLRKALPYNEIPDFNFFRV